MRPHFTLSRWLVGALAAFAQQSKDPYQRLEDVTNDKCLDWVKERNAKTTAELAQSPEFKALDDRLLKILDAKDRVPMISKDGPWYYNFWRDEKNKRGLWRRTTLDEYRKEKPNWEIVLDLDALAADEKENWVWGGVNFLQPKYERCMISLSRGGADAKVTREFDVTTKSFVKDGFTLPEAKSVVSWKDKDTLFVGTDFGKGSLTTSGYPRITKEWKRGTKLEDAKLIYEGEPDDMRAYAYWDLSPGYEREFASRRITFYSGETFVHRGGKFVKIDKPDDAEVRVHREWMFVTPRTEWKVGDKAYPGGSLLVIDFEKFLSGDRNFDVLFEPTARKSLASYSPTKTKVILNELDNVSNRIYVLSRETGTWKREELPGAAPLSGMGAGAVDSDESDDYFLSGSNYLTPSNLSMGTAGSKPPEKLKSGPTY